MTSSSQKAAERYAVLKRVAWASDLFLAVGFLLIVILTPLGRLLSDTVLARWDGWLIPLVVYVTCLGTVGTVLGFPADFASSFLLEHHFGLSNETLGSWFKDYLKRIGVGAVFGMALVLGVVLLLRNFPEHWWLMMGLAWFAASALSARLAPALLIPLFYQQQPLQDQTVRDRLETLVQQCGTQIHGIFEIDLGRTTKKANACLCGMGKSRRVLVSDTLLKSHPIEEIEVILAHEVGHHQLKHLWGLILTSALSILAACRGIHLILTAWGPSLSIESPIDFVALPLIGLGVMAFNILLMPVTNTLSRWMEHQADHFALKQTGKPAAFIAAMHRLAKKNLAQLAPPAWVETIFYDHPSIAKRIAFAQKFADNVEVAGSVK